MANLPEKNITTVSAITSIPSNTNIFINANGQFGQASIDDVVKASNVVSDATLSTMKEFIDNQFKVLTGSPILAQGTEDGYMPSFKGAGGSEQKSYSGKNLFCFYADVTNADWNGLYATYKEYSSDMVLNGSVTTDDFAVAIIEFSLPKGTYTSSVYGLNSTDRIYISKSADSSVIANFIQTGAPKTFTLEEDTSILANMVFAKGTSYSNKTISIQIEEGSTATDYEPYVGNQPSPNPSYTQPIKSKGDCGWFDGELLQGGYDGKTGSFASSTNYICSKNFIPCKADDEITFTYEDDSINNLYIFYYDANKNFLSNASSATNIITEKVPADACYFHFSIYKTNISISTAKKIVVTINGTYAVKVTSRGKNELNCNEITSYSAYGVTFTPVFDTEGKLQYVNVNGTATSGHAYYNFLVKSDFEEGLYTISGCPYINSELIDFRLETGSVPILALNGIGTSGKYGAITNTLYPNTTYKAYIVVKQGITLNNVKFYPMVRRAEITDNTYEPYKEHTEWIPLSEPLRGIGEVTDIIKPTDGLYRGHRKFKEIVFDGSDDEFFYLTATNDYGIGNFTYYLSDNDTAVYPKQIMCNALSMQDKPLSVTTTEGIYNNKTQIVFRISLDRASTVEEFKAWLAENSITVIYELAEEVIEELDQSPFYNLKTFEGVTHISATDDMEMVVEVPTSRAGGVASIGWSKGNLAQIETRNLSAKIAELQTAMVNM